MDALRSRLEKFIRARSLPNRIEQLTPDASTREYFRIRWHSGTAIACVYPEPFAAADHNYVDVTELFLRNRLPVARILDLDESLGVMILEDLGSRILRRELEIADGSARDRLIDNAVRLIPKIQAATDSAFETGSIASRLRFDREKLLWELDFFITHYFSTYRKRPLPSSVEAPLRDEFETISRELESRARVLCHRDFHAANLMVADNGSLKMIDHQDARIGTVSYDLVSLLLDRVTEPPPEAWLSEKRTLFLNERVRCGLAPLDAAAFLGEFRLQAIQRCLKAVGTFSFQSSARGKAYFVPFIRPMLRIVLAASRELVRFPVLAATLEAELND